MGSNISRRSFNLLAGSAALFAGQLGAGFAFAAEGDDPVRGGTLRVLAIAEPPVLTGIDRNGPEIIGVKMLEGLVDIGLDRNPIPALAESWEVSEDARTYTFNLRKGVKWHDGADFTSADVQYSIITLKEVNPRRRATFSQLTAVDTPDAHTAVLRFAAPIPYLFGALGGRWGAPMFPRHLYEGKDLATNPVQQAPVGTGPYMFKEWVRGSHLLLERNPNYWDAPKPYVDVLVMRFIPDTVARSAALEAQELDLGVPPLSDVRRLDELPYLDTEVESGRMAGFANQVFLNLDNPVLQNLKVRQAIAHAIDYEIILRDAWYGLARHAPSVIGPSMPQFHDPSIKPYAFDPKLSEKLLDEAGYPRGGDGKRFPLRLLYNPFRDNVKRVTEYLRSALIEIGIDARMENYDYATYTTKVYTERAFDLDVETYANGYDPTDGVQRGYWSKNIKKGVPFSNASGYSNPRVDEILETAAVEPNFEKRKALYFELQKIVYEDIPSIGFVHQDEVNVFNTRLRNHAPTTTDHLAGAWLKQA